MTLSEKLEQIAWPVDRLDDCLTSLLRTAGLIEDGAASVSGPVSAAEEDIGDWIDTAALHFGCEPERICIGYHELSRELPAFAPSILQICGERYLAVLGSSAKELIVLSPSLKAKKISIQFVCACLREPYETERRVQFDTLLETAGISKRRRNGAIDLLLEDQKVGQAFDRCWLFRTEAGAKPARWFRQINAKSNSITLITAYLAQYIVWLASWAMLGGLSFQGRMDQGWLIGWALLLATLLPLRALTAFLQAKLAVGLGGLLKRRLLCGAMRLHPEELRKCGIGSFLGQALEAEAFETLALGGGLGGVLAILELCVCAIVLGPMAILLLLWVAGTIIFAYSFFKQHAASTDARMHLTQDLVEAMAGHRTRIVQQEKARWHDTEDRALDTYVRVLRTLDARPTIVLGAVPRTWLIAGLAFLALYLVPGQMSDTRTAVLLGGILLAYGAFDRLTAALPEVAAAWTAWKRVGPLFRAASRSERLGCSNITSSKAKRAPMRKTARDVVIEADRLTYRYGTHGNPALQSCSLTVHSEDRILLEGPSGGGKSTFAALLAGMRQAESGLLLANGLDMHTLGETGWRERVVAAPQFHENHIVTETLAFNLLMGKRWPPTQADMAEAECVCRDLGLGDLLDRMPSGLMQLVGEGGWQLSHGERSRVYIARALLQNPELIILDESFGTLDPESLQVAMQCTLERARTLMVIAHP